MRFRRWLARRLDPAHYQAADRVHGCLNGLNEELYADRYGGLGTPGACCYQAVIDYEAAS